jgi:hypothetical protein
VNRAPLSTLRESLQHKATLLNNDAVAGASCMPSLQSPPTAAATLTSSPLMRFPIWLLALVVNMVSLAVPAPVTTAVNLHTVLYFLTEMPCLLSII